MQNEFSVTQSVVTAGMPVGGDYPYTTTLSHWMITSTDVADMQAEETPTLRWVNGSNDVRLEVEEIDLAAFQSLTGLRFNMGKGAFVLSKRISRIMRPFPVWAFISPSELSIVYEDSFDQKEFDGAGVVSRKFLRGMIPHISTNLKPSRIREMKKYLETAKRVEFTIVTERGEDKGHAMVCEDDVEWDFRLPHDTKKEVSTTKDSMVGLIFPHCEKHMRIDVQSLVNMYPFFSKSDLMQWLKDEADLFAESVRSGDVAETMGKISTETSEWKVAEYLYSGGHPMWFASIAKSLMNQHVKRLEMTAVNKLRLPIPGGRYYIMVDAVGQAAGIDVSIPRGQLKMDKANSALWCNAEDWTEFLAETTGGADQDDGYWCVPFTDHDGSSKMLSWRSPNQVAEYLVMDIAEGSDEIEWQTPEGIITYPVLDSRNLPQAGNVQYLDMVDQSTAGGLGEDEEYTIEIMDVAVERAIINRGALGQYCNALMLAKALHGVLPNPAPAPLEDVIDSSVKTGALLGDVKDWCFAYSWQIIESGIEVPLFLQPRLSIPAEKRGLIEIKASSNHWIDELISAVKAHIVAFEATRDELAAQTCPPMSLFDYALGITSTNGSQLRGIYNRTVSEGIRKGGEPNGLTFENAAAKCVEFMADMDSEQRKDTIIQAIAEAYISRANDAVVWQQGDVSTWTMNALRDLGIIEYVNMDDLTTYPSATPYEAANIVTLNGVWFNLAQVMSQGKYNAMSDMTTEERATAKERVAGRNWIQQSFTVSSVEQRLVAHTSSGNLFGFVAKDTVVMEGSYNIRFALVVDGNIHCLCA